MSTQSKGPSRLSRKAAKEVPHRAESRLFAAKASVTTTAEDLIAAVRRANVHEAVRKDLLEAIDRVQHQLHDITVQVPHAASQVKDLAKQLQHLQLAEKWLAAADRVTTRLGDNGPKAVRDALDETRDKVLWLVRADHWDGQLTAAVKKLQRATQDAETKAAQVS